MRKRTVRNGMRLIMAALILIVLVSYCHVQISDLFALTPAGESRLYRLGMFWAAAIGGYGVVVTVFGFVLSPLKNDVRIRILPILFGIAAMIFLFFFLLSSSIGTPARDDQRRMRPGDTITI